MATNSTTEALLKAAREQGTASEDAARAFGQAATNVSKLDSSLGNLGNGAIQFGTALTDGRRGMDKYGASIESAAQGINGLLSMMGIIGKTFGRLALVAGKVAGTILKKNQDILDAYDAFAEFGGASTLTATSLENIATSHIYGISRIHEVAKTLDKLDGSLTWLNSTAGKGIEEFIKIANVSKETREEFVRMGMSQEKLTEAQAQYIKLESYLGGRTQKTFKELQEGSIKYARNLIELSDLTGQSIDQVKEQQEQKRKDFAFNMYLNSLRQKGQTDFADKMDHLTNVFGGIFGPKSQKGLMDIIQFGPNAVGKDAMALRLQTGDAILDWVEQTKRGEMTEDELENRLQNARKETLKKFQSGEQNTAALNAELAEQYGIDDPYFMRSLGKNLELGRTEVSNTLLENKKSQADAIMDSRIESINAGTAMTNAFDSFIELLTGGVSAAFSGLMEATKFLTEGFVQFSKFLHRFNLLDQIRNLNPLSSTETIENIANLQNRNMSDLADNQQFARGLSDVLRGAAPYSTETPYQDNAKGLQQHIARLANTQRLVSETLASKNTGITFTPPAAGTSSTPSFNSGIPALAMGPTSNPQEFRTGGIYKGPGTGYGINDDSPLSGMPKAVIPLPSGEEIPVSIKDLPKNLINKESNLLSQSDAINDILSNYIKALLGPNTGSTETTTSSMANSINMNDVLAIVSDKMNDLVSKMNQNIDVQNDLLILARR